MRADGGRGSGVGIRQVICFCFDLAPLPLSSFVVYAGFKRS